MEEWWCPSCAIPGNGRGENEWLDDGAACFETAASRPPQHEGSWVCASPHGPHPEERSASRRTHGASAVRPARGGDYLQRSIAASARSIALSPARFRTSA